MQTKDLWLTAVIGRPETLKPDPAVHGCGLYFGRITYLIAGVPTDVPLCDVLNVTSRQLSCRPNPAAIYRYEWSSLWLANRR